MRECEQGIVARDRLHHSCCDAVGALDLQGIHRIQELDKIAAEWQAKCESAWAQLSTATLQNDELRNALEEIRKLEGPGLDGSSENRSGKIARLALDGHHGNCDLFDPFGRDKPCNCALKPKAEACSVCHGSRERAGFPCPACAPKPKGESLYEVEMRLRAKEDTEKRKCDEVHPGQDVYHPEGH